MKTESEINEACERACAMHDEQNKKGASAYHGMTFEDGVRNALDWVLENVDEDPTKDE